MAVPSQSDRAETIRMFVAFWTMFFGLTGLIVWAVLHHRAKVFDEFSAHLKGFQLSGLVLPYEVTKDMGFWGPGTYIAKARLAEGVTMSDIAAALKTVPGCEAKYEEKTAECGTGRDFYWGVRVSSVGGREVKASLTPPEAWQKEPSSS